MFNNKKKTKRNEMLWKFRHFHIPTPNIQHSTKFKLIINDNDDGSPCIRTKCHCFK